MPHTSRALVFAALLASPAALAGDGDRLVDGNLARAMAGEIHAVLSTDALPPRSQAQFHAALAALRRATSGDRVSEKLLYASVNRLLATIDSDGHARLIPKQHREARSPPFDPQPHQRRPASLAYTVGGDGGIVLVLAPPATTTQGNPSIAQAANVFLDAVRGVPGAGQACALVVDLSASTGGNAWPGIAALADLVTPANNALVESRDGSRTRLVPPEALEYYTMQLRDENQQLLSRFRSLPFAVVVGRQTSSAGEMIGILLKGEARARVFGWPTGGHPTVNHIVPLSTGDALAVSVGRYSFAGAPAIRGTFKPDVALPASAGKEAALRQAAAWARNQSPACPSRPQHQRR